jgi:hypothetical protein
MQNFTQWLEQRDADFLDESFRDKILGAALALGGGTLGLLGGTRIADEIEKRFPHEINTGKVEELLKKDKDREAAKYGYKKHGYKSVTEDPRDPRNQDPRITNASTEKYGYK